MTEMPKALLFDVFGTVVDWRCSIAREARALLTPKGHAVDWDAFARDWRARYQPAMERVRSSARGFRAPRHAPSGKPRRDTEGLPREPVSKRPKSTISIAPGTGSIPGPTRRPGSHGSKRAAIIATLSNGNIALMVNMAPPWRSALGCDPRRGGRARLQAAARGLSAQLRSARS